MGNTHPQKLMDNMKMTEARPLFTEEDFELIAKHVHEIGRTLDDFTVRDVFEEPTLGYCPSTNQ